MRTTKFMTLALAVSLFFIGGCSNDDGGPTGPVGTSSTTRDALNRYWITRIDATSDDAYTYYSFATRDVVPVSKTARVAVTNWHLAFKRAVIITNGGDFGDGDVEATDFTGLGNQTTFVDVTAADAASVPAEDWMTDGKNLVIDDYYTYNPQTHSLAMTQYVYALRDAEGMYAKVQFTGLYGGGAPPAMGNFVIKYVYQPSTGSLDLTGPVVTDTVNGSTGVFYYDFSGGSVVTPTDPANSLGWDIKVQSYDVFLNSSFSGPGQAAANPAYLLVDGMTDPKDFDYYAQAVPVAQAYSQDEEGSVFTDWYDYDGNTHTLSSKGHVYLVRSGEKTYKVAIDSYYGDTGQSGNYIFFWEEL